MGQGRSSASFSRWKSCVNHRIAQNHRMVGVGRDLGGSSVLHDGAGACRDFSCSTAVSSTSSLMPLRLRFEQHRVWLSIYKITFAFVFLFN